MDDLDILRRRMRIANLEARRELHEIERDALTRQINSRLKTPWQREEAIERRDDLLSEWAKVVEELQSLYRAA